MIDFNKYPLPLQFSDTIQSIWSIQFRAQAAIIPIIPDAYPEIIIPLYGSVQSFVGNKKGGYSLNRPFIIGQLGKISYLKSTGRAAFVSIKLYPWLLSNVLKDKAALAKNQLVDATLVFPNEIVTALKELQGFSNNLEIQQHLHAIILPLLWQYLQQTKISFKPIAAYAVQQFFAAKGQLNSTDLASKLNCSRRYLELVFKDFIGISPKQYARIIRTKKASILPQKCLQRKPQSLQYFL